MKIESFKCGCCQKVHHGKTISGELDFNYIDLTKPKVKELEKLSLSNYDYERQDIRLKDLCPACAKRFLDVNNILIQKINSDTFNPFDYNKPVCTIENGQFQYTMYVDNIKSVIDNVDYFAKHYFNMGYRVCMTTFQYVDDSQEPVRKELFEDYNPYTDNLES